MTSAHAPDHHGATLLTIARATLCSAFGLDGPAWSDAPWLSAPAATFVTLTQDGDLRGCIGSLEPVRPLRDDVAQNALAAAFRDPRFPALGRHEVEVTSIEVSVLTRPAPLPVADEAEARARLRPGVDGVILTAGACRATFLPQVWEDLPDPAEFLAHLRRKAGLPASAWPAGTRLEVYQVTKFAERPRGQQP